MHNTLKWSGHFVSVHPYLPSTSMWVRWAHRGSISWSSAGVALWDKQLHGFMNKCYTVCSLCIKSGIAVVCQKILEASISIGLGDGRKFFSDWTKETGNTRSLAGKRWPVYWWSCKSEIFASQGYCYIPGYRSQKRSIDFLQEFIIVDYTC